LTSDNQASEPVTIEATPGSPKQDPILKIDNVVRSFGGLRAVDIDHLEVQRGIITAFIGPNGAGKTTLFNLITGFDKPDSGKWTFHQLSNAESWTTDLSGLRPHQIANKGMVRTFQLTKSLAKMTVIDNMLLGAAEQKGESLRNALLPSRWQKQEKEILENKKIEPFGSEGDVLDPELHDAMMTQSDKKKDDNIILSVFEKGYRYHDKVIRHAKVVVNKK